MANAISSAVIPIPLSVMLILSNPEFIKSTLITLANASILFSINSLTILLGRSITSPAAIIFVNSSDNSIILGLLFIF